MQLISFFKNLHLMDLWADFLAGSFGGIAGTIIGHPIDTIKVNRQTSSHSVKISFSNQNVISLFRGMSSPLCTSALVNATFFGVYGNTIKFISHVTGTEVDAQPSLSRITIAGMVAGAVQLLINCPVELVKIKLQTDLGTGNYDPSIKKFGLPISNSNQKQFKGPINCLAILYKTQGLRGWYKGLVPMFYRDAPSYGFYMFLYEWILREGGKYTDGGWSESLLPLVAGGITGTVTWVSVLPIDVVKSRIQADCPYHPKYRGMLNCIKVSYETEGLKVFFRGLGPIALRALIVNATTFFIYNSSLKKLNAAF